MERIKIFRGQVSTEDIDKRINTWLEEMGNKIEITHTMQSLHDSGFIISIFYRENDDEN